MKILTFADMHLRSMSDRPKWRRDDHYISQFEELKNIRDLAVLHKVDLIVSLGDFFDHVRVSFQLVNDVMNWCKTLPCSIASVVGNHDVSSYVTEDKNNGLGILFEAGAVERLDDMVFEKEKVVFRGIHVFLDPTRGDYLFDLKFNAYKKYIFSHNFVIPHEVPFPAVLPSQIKTNADILFFGHYHKAFDHMEGTTRFINSGSISRWSVNELHKPKVLILDTVTNIITPIELSSSKDPSEIFDLAAASEMKSTEMNLQTFVDSLNSTSFEQQDIEQVVLTEGSKQGILKEILDVALSKVQQSKVELR